ncbi:MAG: bifunctional nuclease family protein, partial [Bacteroidota bacterium]
MKKVELNIIALANSESSKGNYALILEEQKGFRRLPIIIGAFEAQAIAVSLEKMQPNRPLTHDLFKNTLALAGITISEVLISDLVGGVF